MSEEVSLSKNKFLLREGEDSNEMYLVRSGTLAVMKVQGSAEKQIGTVYSGELVGEMSFLDEAPRSASVKGVTDSELVVVPRERFNKLFRDLPPWFKSLVHTLLERLRKANNRIRI